VKSRSVTLAVLSILLSASHLNAQSSPAPDILRIREALNQLEDREKLDAARAYYGSWRGLADGLEVVGTAGNTNRTAGYAEPGNHYPIAFGPSYRDGENLFGVEIGLVEKKVVRDLCVAFGDGCLERYLRDGDVLRWALLDAVQLDARGGYGQRLEGRGPELGLLYYVGLKWTLPLTGPGKNPLDE